MITIGTPLSATATKVLLCGAGELGKELVIELQRLGVEVTAIDRYPNAPAMQVAHRSHVIDMLDPAQLRSVIEAENPDLVVPEIEAIATSELVRLEAEGYVIVPSARAVHLTMNREGIRRLAAEELGLRTSRYCFAQTFDGLLAAVSDIGLPVVIKPVMSSSGKGQTIVHAVEQLESAWSYAQQGGRAGGGMIIVESLVEFDYEITLLTVSHAGGISFCDPIGHVQEDGDYRESWQPQPMTQTALDEAKRMARSVVGALGGLGVFGVEFFVKGDQVTFSEVSPRPHDTGLVTLISQNLSEFALHARAILGLPIPQIVQRGACASSALLVAGVGTSISYSGLAEALSEPNTDLRLFGKPSLSGRRRMGVGLAMGKTLDEAVSKAKHVRQKIVASVAG